MIKFIQKQYTEYDAMRALYVELMKYSDRNKFNAISPSELIPILKGNNIVIERFVITHQTFGRDKYRMYLKIGAKAKLPDDIRLAGEKVYDRNLFNISMKLNGSQFSKNNKNDGGKGLSTEVKTPFLSISQEVHELLGEAVKYDKKERSLVLEFKSISDAIRALNILPFGLSYKIYLLDA